MGGQARVELLLLLIGVAHLSLYGLEKKSS
jgi:hypothetical protein